ncbi:MAG: hypothetical protein L0Y71_11440 [Gemmataceae bacterium]|nr:hypothetical protein [Gemmataceae bacterium]
MATVEQETPPLAAGIRNTTSTKPPAFKSTSRCSFMNKRSGGANWLTVAITSCRQTDGILRSRAFPGLWLDGAAMLQHDVPKFLAKLHEGLASAEHQAFVEQLAKKRAGG